MPGAWTYSGDPTASAKDEIRFLTADQDQTKAWTLYDAEIAYAVSLYSSNPPVIGQNFLAAAVCAESILAKFKGIPESKSVGDLSISWGQQFKFYQEQAYRLRQRAALQTVKPYVGGTSIQEKRGVDADADRVQPAVKIGGMDYASPLNSLSGDDPTGGP